MENDTDVFYEIRVDPRTGEHPGSFECAVCKTEIKSWTGIDRYFDWKQLITKSPGGGKI